MKRARAVIVSLATLVAAFATSTPALAGSEADRLFTLGRRASDMGKYATACSLFRESYQLEPAVGTLLNLGDCEEQQNHVAASLEYYQTALSRLSVTDDRLGPLRTRIEAIERRSGQLEMRLGEGAPRDAKVLVDGEAMPPEKLKTPLALFAGGHLVVVTAVGYRGSRQTVDLAAGEKKTIFLWPGPQLDAAELAFAGEDRIEVAEAEQQRHARTMRIVGWSTVGAGAASLWVGSVTGLFAIDRESLRSENCNASNVCNATGVEAAKSGSTLATVSTITLAAGAVAVGAGVYLLLSNPNDGARATPATVLRAAPTVGGAAVMFEETF